MQKDMTNIRVFDEALNFIGEVSNFRSLIFVRRWETAGDFEIHLDVPRKDLFKNGYYIMIDNDPYMSGIIEYEYNNGDAYQIDSTKDFSVKGYSLAGLLSRRVTVPNDGGDGYTHYVDIPVEDIMTDLVERNTTKAKDANRVPVNFSVATSQGRGAKTTFDTRYKNLLTELNTLSTQSELGFAVKLDAPNKKLVFEVLQGTDRRYSSDNANSFIFAKKFGRVKSQVYEHSTLGTSNYAYALGEGDGADRTLVIAGDDTTAGWGRRELYVDARDIANENAEVADYDAKKSLKERGEEKLGEVAESLSYEFEADTREYRDKWDLGDKCTFWDGDENVTQENIVTEVTETWENSQHTIDPVAGHTTTSILSAIQSAATSATVERTGLSANFDAITARLVTADEVIAGKVDTKTLTAYQAQMDEALIGKASVEQLDAANAKIGKLETDKVSTDELDATNADVANLKTKTADIDTTLIGKANIDLANVKAGSITTALIGTGAVDTAQIADGSITDAKIVGLTANKITAGTLDAAHIDVVNLNAANITVGTINGKQIAPGAVDISKLGTDVTGEIDNAQSTADTANTAAGKAQTTADGAQSTADTANSNAGKAQDTANAANSTANTANATANTANATANTAKTNAATAQKDATQALADAKAASDAATKAQTAADKAQTDVDTAETDLANTKTSLTGALGRLDVTEKDIATAQADVKTAQSTADTANSAASTANTAAGKAQTAANGAQTTANSAQSAANAAQSTADTAKANAANAQSTADTANTTANATKTIAESNTKKITNDEAQIATLITNTTLTTDGKTVQLKDAYSETVDDVNGLKTTVSSQQGTLDTATGDIKDIKSQQSTTTADLSGLKNTVTSLSSTVATVSGAANKAQDTANSATTAANTAQATADKKADQTDLDGLTTTVTKNYSDLSNTIDGFKTTVSSTYATQTTVNSVKNTADTANSTANTAVANASKAQSTADKAQATADNIEVGGRNLILNSKTNFDNSNYPTGVYDLSEELQRGETYTYQIKGTLAEGSTGWLFCSNKERSFGALPYYEKYDSDKGIYYQTFLCRDVQTSPTDIFDRVNIYSYPNQTGKIATIEWVKLEKGNKPTDWTPAPEDVDASITAVDSKVTTISTRTNTLENTTTGMKSDVSALQTTIKTKADNSTVTSVDNKVSTLTNTVNGLSSTVSSVSSVANGAASAAKTAQTTADDNYNKVTSRGENLITNGSGLLGDNTNFPAFKYTAKETYGCPGGFYRDFASGYCQAPTSEYFPVDISKNYRLSCWLKATYTKTRYYLYIDQYDVDKNQINIQHCHFIQGSTTTLSQDLKNGDTVVHFTDLTGWNETLTPNYQRGFIIWNYKNSTGYQYPIETYSRNVFDSLYSDNSAVDKTAKTITLSKPWANGTVPAGTSLSQCTSGGTLFYLSSGFYPGSWTQITGLVGADRNPFWAGTAFCKIGWLWNYDCVTTGTGYFANMTFGIDNANQADLDNTNKNVTAITTRTATLETNVNSITGRVTATETVANTAKTNASTAQTAANNAQSTANTANTNAGKAQTTANTANATANTATSNISGLTTRVTSAESKLTATALTTTISSGIAGSNAIDTTKFTMDKNGLTIKNGGLIVQNATANTVATIGANGVLQTGLITAANITASTITGGLIAAGTISANNLASNSITADKIVSGAVTTEKLAAKAVTANNMAANSITAANGAIADATITNAKIVSVNADKINASSLSAISANLGTVTAGTLSSVVINSPTINVKENVGSINFFDSYGKSTGKIESTTINSSGIISINGDNSLNLHSGESYSLTIGDNPKNMVNAYTTGDGKICYKIGDFDEIMIGNFYYVPVRSHFHGGSSVLTVSNDSSAPILTASNIAGYLGTNGAPIDINQVAVFAANGDASGTAAHVTGCTTSGSTVYVTFDRVITATVRINWMIFYFGNWDEFCN